MPPKNRRKASKSSANTRCSTLLEDEITRCSEAPTHGRRVERCRVHHEQYCTMTTRDHGLYSSVSEVLEKARLLKDYVNAIRQERTGREIHHNRFFLKVDDGHKIRINLLAKRMAEGVEIRDALEARAMALHMESHPARDWMHQFQGSSELEIGSEDTRGVDGLVAYIREHDKKLRAEAALHADDDLIALQLRFQREVKLEALGLFINPEKFWPDYHRFLKKPDTTTAEEKKIRALHDKAWAQYFRRMVFHDPQLFARSLGKVSFKDLVLDDEFTFDDLLRIQVLMGQRLTFGLTWWKDCLTEAIFIRDCAEASANMGSLENRVKILGGWIYNNSRNTPAPNKVWWTLLTCEEQEKDIENRYVRLCCNFDELHTFLTMSAFVMEAPSFCTTGDGDSTATRKHLSLSGVLVTGMVGRPEPQMVHPFPSPKVPAKRVGCVTWVQIETRAYIFGAIQLRARPDLFSVVTRSDTDPPRKLESFGDVTDQVRMRQFEAPLQRTPPTGQGDWKVLRSAEEVLYGADDDSESPYMKIPGYLSANGNKLDSKGRPIRWFFFHKRFPVKYFLILNASPKGNVHDLARQVSWAAFRAQGLVHGNYDEGRYDKASDVLFIKHARERLSFLPEGGYKVGNLASSQ
ncbi:hypothetical protein C8R46DRAFT_1227108 [Mycena filopes]|nr:hypothetical protein C8R46DRAFT_1227108 [Mycena filopes]